MSLVCALILPSVSASMYFYYTVDTTTTNKQKNSIIRDERKSSTNELQIVNDTNSMQQLHIGLANGNEATTSTTTTTKTVFSNKRAFTLLWSHFKTSYSNKSIVLWSVWWALATCGMYQVSENATETQDEDFSFFQYSQFAHFLSVILCEILKKKTKSSHTGGKLRTVHMATN